MGIIYKWLLFSIAAYVSSLVVPGIHIEPIGTALIIGMCLAFVHTVVRPIIGAITLHINILTHTITALLLNGVVYWFLAQQVAGFTVTTITAALLGGLLTGLVSWFLGKFIRD